MQQCNLKDTPIDCNFSPSCEVREHMLNPESDGNTVSKMEVELDYDYIEFVSKEVRARDVKCTKILMFNKVNP